MHEFRRKNLNNLQYYSIYLMKLHKIEKAGFKSTKVHTKL